MLYTGNMTMECYYCARKGYLVCPECMNEYMKKKTMKKTEFIDLEFLYTTDVYSLLNRIVELQTTLFEKEKQINCLQDRLDPVSLVK